jgi:methionyl aminopeptidase
MQAKPNGIQVKSVPEIERMRDSCRIAAEVLDDVARACTPGTSTAELDEYAAERIRSYGARSAFLGYRGYPGTTCISVNDVVVHGIPGPYRVQLGDLVSIDVGVVYEGWIGDNARTVMAGVRDAEVIRLVHVTEKALSAGIAMASPGRRLSDISHAIEKVVTGAGFSIVKDFVGHGVGRSMHEEPQIPNFGPPGRGPRLKPGTTLAIEPMVNQGRGDVEMMEDGWTVRTGDRLASAHFEHTVLVSEDGPEILTCKKTS